MVTILNLPRVGLGRVKENTVSFKSFNSLYDYV